MAMLRVERVVRGYHVYMDNWSPPVGNEFELELEQLNRHDRYAVVIQVSNNIGGHVLSESQKVYTISSRMTAG